jgi:hypothetical protein
LNLQDLGNLGEFVGAIAVVVTLAYLALQIRQNTRALGHAEQRAILEDGNNWRANLIQDPKIAELYRKGLLDPDALDPIERLRFRMLLDALFVTWLYGFRAGQLTGYAFDPHIRGTLARPGGTQYWAHHKANFDPEFVQYVDSLAPADDEDG